MPNKIKKIRKLKAVKKSASKKPATRFPLGHPAKRVGRLRAAKARPAVKINIKTAKPKKPSFLKREMLKKLLETRRKLLEEVAQKVKSESNINKFEIGDIYDIASSERERELILTLGDRERERLHDINRAIERLRNKNYGLCEECGEPIGENRLRALPFTRVCVDCKTKTEKEAIIKGGFEEKPSLGIIEGVEAEEEEF